MKICTFHSNFVRNHRVDLGLKLCPIYIYRVHICHVWDALPDSIFYLGGRYFSQLVGGVSSQVLIT